MPLERGPVDNTTQVRRSLTWGRSVGGNRFTAQHHRERRGMFWCDGLGIQY